MQSFSNSPAPLQQLPEGWNFPTVADVVGTGHPAGSMPISGGGAAAATMTKVRWGRLLVVLAGLVVLGFSAWALLSGGINTKPAPRTATGAGANEIDAPKGARTVGGGPAVPMSKDGPAAPSARPSIAPPKAAQAPSSNAPVSKAPGNKGSTSRPVSGGRAPAIGAGAGARTVAQPTMATAVPRTTVAGGGGPAAMPADGAELPLTGIETWIAAFIGLLLLAFGICVHVNAVRIGMTAMLYRRGILLRPVDCARLAHRRGLPRARILLSNALHRLLAQPANGGDFVSARRTAS